MIRREAREVFITDDNQEFASELEAVKHDRTKRLKELVNFPCKQDRVVAEWVWENYHEIKKIMEN